MDLRVEFGENEKKIEGLIDSMCVLGDSGAKINIARRIEQLSEANRKIENRIREVEELSASNCLSDAEFERQSRKLALFGWCVDEMPVEERRAAIRMLIQKVIWDGVSAHVVLLGADEEEIEYRDIDALRRG